MGGATACKVMLKKHPHHSIPAADTVIWRYLDLNKFQSLLSTSAIYFAKADALQAFDAREGSLTKSMEYFIDRTFTLDWVSNLRKQNVQTFAGVPFVGRGRLELRDEFRRRMRNHYRFMLSRMYVNCWHINEHENYLMWQNYVQNKPGIAIKTTVGRLQHAFEGSAPEVFCVNVNYVDHDSTPLNWESMPGGMSQIAMDMLTKKGAPFKGETELRLVTDILTEDEKWKRGLFLIPKGPLLPLDNPRKSVEINVDLNTLIEEVILQPGSAWEFRKAVTEAVIQAQPPGAVFGFRQKISHSRI